MWCRASDIETASERAAFHAERAGDRAALPDVAVSRMVAPFLGMARPEEGIRRCEEIRAWLPDDRFIGAMADMLQGGCQGQLGLFEEGRRQQRRAEEVVLDLGQKLWLGGVAMNAASARVLAGDLESAERRLRHGMEYLESIGSSGTGPRWRPICPRALRAGSLRRGRRDDRRVRGPRSVRRSVNQVTARGIQRSCSPGRAGRGSGRHGRGSRRDHRADRLLGQPLVSRTSARSTG